jgi:hypothetical protein
VLPRRKPIACTTSTSFVIANENKSLTLSYVGDSFNISLVGAKRATSSTCSVKFMDTSRWSWCLELLTGNEAKSILSCLSYRITLERVARSFCKHPTAALMKLRLSTCIVLGVIQHPEHIN